MPHGHTYKASKPLGAKWSRTPSRGPFLTCHALRAQREALRHLQIRWNMMCTWALTVTPTRLRLPSATPAPEMRGTEAPESHQVVNPMVGTVVSAGAHLPPKGSMKSC